MDRKMGYPFNPVTQIEFEVPNSVFVVLEIYDVLGDLIKTVVRGRFEPGKFSITWKATNDRGQRANAGVYFLRLQAPELLITFVNSFFCRREPYGINHRKQG